VSILPFLFFLWRQPPPSRPLPPLQEPGSRPDDYREPRETAIEPLFDEDEENDRSSLEMEGEEHEIHYEMDGLG
jgi:hypothetical protein